MKKHYEVGWQGRRRYALHFDKFKNQQACDDSIANKWAWFLEIDGIYVGNFQTKKEAMAQFGVKP